MSEILTGIDVGSSNVCCVIGEETGKEKLNILGYSQISCNGLRSGVVVNIEETVLAIRQAIEEAEDK
ncbi:MAG TPA: cell division protein FtsA, partial [bacterium]|nr:cell division protein FtsA [bacterium]